MFLTMKENLLMSGKEIKKKVDANNAIIERGAQEGTFTLKPEVRKAIEENLALRAKCPHKYSDGVCIYCYKDEE